LAIWNLCHTQTPITISGKVISAKDGQPLPYAYTQLKDVALGTVTSPEGTFTIHIPEKHQNGVLQFTYLGYQTESRQINQMKDRHNLIVSLQESSTALNEVVIESKKGLSAKQVLRKVLQNIPNNYASDSFNMTGYYRETLKENGVYIKYADAACEYYLAPYTGKTYHKKKLDKFDHNDLGNAAIGFYSLNWGDRLHRGHFNGRTLKEEQVKIIEARASANLSKTYLNANIEGGPLGIVGRDRVKYLRYFLDKKQQHKYTFSLTERANDRGEWQYVISFKPKIKKEDVERIAAQKKIGKRYALLQRLTDKPLAGKIVVDPTSFAVVSMEYRVPKELKHFFCGYTTMAIKHFDYSIKINYQQINNRWYPATIRQEDEFIIVDTISNTTTPYAANKKHNLFLKRRPSPISMSTICMIIHFVMILIFGKIISKNILRLKLTQKLRKK